MSKKLKSKSIPTILEEPPKRITSLKINKLTSKYFNINEDDLNEDNDSNNIQQILSFVRKSFAPLTKTNINTFYFVHIIIKDNDINETIYILDLDCIYKNNDNQFLVSFNWGEALQSEPSIIEKIINSEKKKFISYNPRNVNNVDIVLPYYFINVIDIMRKYGTLLSGEDAKEVLEIFRKL